MKDFNIEKEETMTKTAGAPSRKNHWEKGKKDQRHSERVAQCLGDRGAARDLDKQGTLKSISYTRRHNTAQL